MKSKIDLLRKKRRQRMLTNSEENTWKDLLNQSLSFKIPHHLLNGNTHTHFDVLCGAFVVCDTSL